MKKVVEKTKFSQIHLHPFGIVITIDGKKRALDDSKLIEVCNTVRLSCEIDDDKYEIVITLSDGKNKQINFSKPFQLLKVNTELKTLTSKDKKGLKTIPILLWKLLLILLCIMIW
ncbi:MAG: hypothetical protein Ta2E_01330 [Mycoplasmoidaceae bacterium]|nr:MAG: hypothetical protein Ta2E_01330 [Mycoplasmoidaceae bacterium]